MGPAKAVRHQIAALSRVASAFLVPDNHLGRATISSVAVAHEVDQMGGRSIACLNARVRNLLGFRRDLMTAAAYGVDEFLLVYGDRPSVGARTGELNVRSMLQELARFDPLPSHRPGLRGGVTTRLEAVPEWKRAADFLFVQATFDLGSLLRWREATSFEGDIYAGVLVAPSSSRARKWATDLREVEVPESLIDALDSDRAAGGCACLRHGDLNPRQRRVRWSPPHPGRQVPRGGLPTRRCSGLNPPPSTETRSSSATP